MNYLVIDGARVVSAHRTLASARSAEAQGIGRSTEPGPLLGGEPAWWMRRNGGMAELGVPRTDAAELGFRFELRACQAPASSCRHRPCATYATWAVSRWYGLLSELAAFVPLSWIWIGKRSDDPRGDAPQFPVLEMTGAVPAGADESRPDNPRYGSVLRWRLDREGQTRRRHNIGCCLSTFQCVSSLSVEPTPRHTHPLTRHWYTAIEADLSTHKPDRCPMGVLNDGPPWRLIGRTVPDGRHIY